MTQGVTRPWVVSPDDPSGNLSMVLSNTLPSFIFPKILIWFEVLDSDLDSTIFIIPDGDGTSDWLFGISMMRQTWSKPSSPVITALISTERAWLGSLLLATLGPTRVGMVPTSMRSWIRCLSATHFSISWPGASCYRQFLFIFHEDGMGFGGARWRSGLTRLAVYGNFRL